jgi:hypothetical protein
MKAVAEAAQTRAWCALEPPARGLGRIRHRQATDLLRYVWESTEHSLSRLDILTGLAGCARNSGTIRDRRTGRL